MIGDLLAGLSFLSALVAQPEICLALASLTLIWCVVAEAHFSQ